MVALELLSAELLGGVFPASVVRQVTKAQDNVA